MRTLTVESALLVVLFPLTMESPAWAQQPEETVPQEASSAEPATSTQPPLRDRRKMALRALKEDGIYLGTFPRRPTRRGLVITSIWVASIGAVFLLDEEIREEVQEERNDTLDRWEGRIEPLGNAQTTTAAALLTYGVGRMTHHEGTTETGRALIETLLFTESFTKIGKGLFGREPPGDGNEGEFFQGDTLFPSGHTSRSFAVATVLARRHGRAAAWIAYPLATLVGLSRIESDVHWASDVLAGAGLGHLIGRTIVRRREERAAAPRVQVSWMLDPARSTAGVRLGIRLDGWRRGRRERGTIATEDSW